MTKSNDWRERLTRDFWPTEPKGEQTIDEFIAQEIEAAEKRTLDISFTVQSRIWRKKKFWMVLLHHNESGQTKAIDLPTSPTEEEMHQFISGVLKTLQSLSQPNQSKDSIL